MRLFEGGNHTRTFIFGGLEYEIDHVFQNNFRMDFSFLVDCVVVALRIHFAFLVKQFKAEMSSLDNNTAVALCH